jgi:uncharacterized glyoxalase superfamily protein PhnB
MANLPPNTQRIVPYLSYKKGKSAIDFLAKAFGFEVRGVLPGPGESVMHAELGLGDSVVYLGTPDGYDPARAKAQRNAAVLVYVDDVDAHCARAREAGAKIDSEPADMFYGDRVYNARDLEGQLWFFHTHVRDVTPEEMQAAMANMPSRPQSSAAPKRAKKKAAQARGARAAKRPAKKAKKAAKKK